MTIRRKRRWVLEIIIGNDTNAVHLWTQITYPCEGRQVKHFWCSHFKTNIQTDNIHTYKEFVDSDLKVPMLHRNCKKKKMRETCQAVVTLWSHKLSASRSNPAEAAAPCWPWYPLPPNISYFHPTIHRTHERSEVMRGTWRWYMGSLT